MEILTQISFVLGILAYGVVLSLHIPEKYHFVTNACMAAITIVAGLQVGLSVDDMGMGLHVVFKGIFVACVVSAAIVVGVFIVASVPSLRRYFVLAQHMRPNRVAYETAVRIPLSTALSEEILFRGVLLGILLSYNGTIISVGICSLTFGLWHIFPGLDRLRMQKSTLYSTRGATTIFAVTTILATALAGIFFCWLRILAGSIIAPWLTHWSINASAMLASEFVTRRNTKATVSREGKR